MVPGLPRLRGVFSEREADGTNVVICNPRLVKTGLNLIGWPSIVVLEPVYSLYDLFQAKRRAFRPTQTRDCEVVFVCYRRTMSERALGVIARKAGAAAILSGDDLSGGLLEFDPGMSLLQELAKSVTQGDGDAMNEDVRAMLQDAARKFKQSMENGHADMLGVDPMALPMNQPAVSTPPATLIATDCFETPVDEALMPIPVPAATLGLFKTVSVQTLVTGKGSKKAAPAPAVTHEQWVMDL